MHQHRPRPVAAGVQDPRPAVCGLEAEREAPIGPAIERRAQRYQLPDALGPFAREDADRLGVREPVARRQRIGGVQGRAVSGAEGRRDAPLRPGAGTVSQAALGHQETGATRYRHPPRGPQAGEAGPDDDGARGVHRAHSGVSEPLVPWQDMRRSHWCVVPLPGGRLGNASVHRR